MQVCDLAERQGAAGHDVTVITSTRAAVPSAQFQHTRIVRVDRAISQPGRIGYLHSNRIGGVLTKEAHDVVHIHASTFSPLSFLAARRAAQRQIPAVLTVHSVWASATPLFQRADRVGRWSEWPVEWAAVSDVAAAPLRRVLPSRIPVAVIPNGVDPDLWLTGQVVGGRAELRVVAVGRLAPRKRTMGLARLLRDARGLLPAPIRLSVEIIGDGPERGPLQRYLGRHGMEEWVTLRGRADRGQIQAAFARSDLFVAPAVLESFGIAALEARCSGLPILARAGTGIQEFIDPGVEGWLVRSDQAMADMIVDLAVDRDRLQQVAAHNRQKQPGINWDTILERYDELYRTAAARHQRAWVPAAPGHPIAAAATAR